MIRIKERPPAPNTLSSDKVREIQEKIRRMVGEENYPTSDDFPSSHLRGDVRKTLWLHQDTKCCYCERKRDEKGEPDIEHFRPKTEIKGEGKPGYWWLAYEWDNLFFSCRACNQSKGTAFPIQDKGRRARRPTDDLSVEQSVLPDLVEENPEEFIAYHFEYSPISLVKEIGKDDGGRGTKTIEILKLNRDKLPDERGEVLSLLMPIAQKMHAGLHSGKPILIENAKEEIERETRSEKRFAGFRRCFFHQQGLGGYVSTS